MDTNIKSDINQNYIILKREDLPIIDFNLSNDSNILEKLLLDFPYIYVENDNKQLVGIISKNDYYRKFSSRNHVNQNYLFINANQNNISEANELHEKKRISEIPVINEASELLYVLKYRKNIILRFDFDWALCDMDSIKQFFSGYNNVLYFTSTNKIFGLINRTSEYLKINKIDDFSEYHDGDIILCNEDFVITDVISFTIEEVFLTILSMSSVKRLNSKHVKYYFFQGPIDNKIRKENKLFFKTSCTHLTKDELLPAYDSDIKDMNYWLLQDYKKLRFGEIDGRYLPQDVKSETLNIINNQRVTLSQPTQYTNTIWVLGTCIARGYGVSDEMTIPSILQKMLNNNHLSNYIVQNLGTGGGLNYYSDIRDFVNISRTDIQKDDIVIHLGYNCWELNNSKVIFDEYYELSWLYNRKLSGRCFLDGTFHLTPYANRIAAKYIFDSISKDLKQIHK